MLLLAWVCQTNGALLQGQFRGREPGSNVPLTSAGGVDWVHWGFTGTNATRKSGSTVIGNLVSLGGAAQRVTNEVEFSWSNGTPSVSATNVVTSVATPGVTNGFSIEIPAETSLQKLKIYAGAFAARAQLSVTLDGAPAYVNYALDSLEATNGWYLVDFIASKNNDKIKVKLSAATLHAPNGFVSLHAVALGQNSAPSVTLTSPAEESSVAVGVPCVISADASDADGTVSTVEFFIGATTKIGTATNMPFQISWTPTNIGAHTLTARATDHNGLQATTPSRSFYVTGTNGTVVGEVALAPANVDLTVEGPADWVHWGFLNENSVNRKTGIALQLSDLEFIGIEPHYSYADNSTTFSWSDGAPIVSATETPTGIFVAGRGNGFQLSAPADTTPRTLKIYLGSYGARGKFTATLSDYSAPVYIDRSVENFGNGPASVYTLNYAAGSPDQTLDVVFTCDKMHDLQYGNVTWQAAALVSAISPLGISLSSPANNAVFPAPANVPLEASVVGGQGSARRVEFFQGATKLGQVTAPPYSFPWNNVGTGNYTLTARTTNDVGITLTSAPVQIFITSTGGVMRGKFEISSGAVDLTAEGTDDWVHWGLERRNSVDRKNGVPPKISDFTEIGRGFLDQYGDNRVSFSWSDGTPNSSVGGTTTGVFKYDLHNGFQISVPADRTFRRLRVYVGVFAAQGELEASLGDVSAAPFIDSSLSSVYNNATAVYTIDYAAASPGQVLKVRYTSKTLFDASWGNVTLQSATLSFVPPVITTSLGSAGILELSFHTHPGWDYFLDCTDAFANPQQWQVLTNFPGDGGSLVVMEPLQASSRFYRLRMERASQVGVRWD